jgi:hypothetical protein
MAPTYDVDIESANKFAGDRVRVGIPTCYPFEMRPNRR